MLHSQGVSKPAPFQAAVYNTREYRTSKKIPFAIRHSKPRPITPGSGFPSSFFRHWRPVSLAWLILRCQLWYLVLQTERCSSYIRRRNGIRHPATRHCLSSPFDLPGLPWGLEWKMKITQGSFILLSILEASILGPWQPSSLPFQCKILPEFATTLSSHLGRLSWALMFLGSHSTRSYALWA